MSHKVLLVEPDISLAKIYKLHLEQNNHEVTVCTTSQQAIEKMDGGETPDMIILETQMAMHDGYEFLYELRSYPEWLNIPVIIHSMIPKHVINQNLLTAPELGVRDYLYKPSCSLAKLLYSVEHYALSA